MRCHRGFGTSCSTLQSSRAMFCQLGPRRFQAGSKMTPRGRIRPQHGHEMGPRGPEMAPRGLKMAPKMVPRGLKVAVGLLISMRPHRGFGTCYSKLQSSRAMLSHFGPRSFQDGSKMTPRGPIRPYDVHRIAPRGPKMSPRGPKMAPKMAPRGPRDGPNRPQEATAWFQDGSGRPHDGLKTAQDEPDLNQT